MGFFMAENFSYFSKIAPVLCRKCARFVPEVCPMLAFSVCPFCAGFAR
jgi:hypothetical protein